MGSRAQLRGGGGTAAPKSSRVGRPLYGPQCNSLKTRGCLGILQKGNAVHRMTLHQKDLRKTEPDQQLNEMKGRSTRTALTQPSSSGLLVTSAK